MRFLWKNSTAGICTTYTRKMEQETNSLRRIDDSFERIVVVGENLIRNRDDNGILFMSI